jgi:hypothetical protein
MENQIKRLLALASYMMILVAMYGGEIGGFWFRITFATVLGSITMLVMLKADEI